MDSGIHAFLIAQHAQTRIAEAQTTRAVREAQRGPARLPKLRLRRVRRRSPGLSRA